MPKPDLGLLVTKLRQRKQVELALAKARAEAKPEPVQDKPLQGEIAKAMAEATALTEFEVEQASHQAQQAARPWDNKAPDIRKPWLPKGGFDVKQGEKALPVQERIAFNNALAKAKRGQRLTLKDRKLLGKHQLKRILAGLRSSNGE